MNDTKFTTYRLSMPLFLAVTAGVFMLLTLTLVMIDFYPEPVISLADDGTDDIRFQTPTSTDSVEVVAIPDVAPETPTRIVIERIGVDTIISNPESTDINVLDRALQTGAVRYPGSGKLNERANMLIFGHSSYLPVVHNKAYQAFNELQRLTEGDVITVYADDIAHEYEVTAIRHARAEDVSVPLTASEPTLTLSTCNTFGAKEDRWIVTAKLSSSL